MFKKLFGSSNAPAASQKKQAAPVVDPMTTMQRLQEQIDAVKARSKKVEVEMQNRLKEALEKKKQKDNRGKLNTSNTHKCKQKKHEWTFLFGRCEELG